MRKTLLVVLLFFGLGSLTFGQEVANMIKGSRPPINLNNVPSSAFRQGRISIKFTRLVGQWLGRAALSDNYGFVKFNIPQVDALNRLFKVTKATQIFEKVIDNTRFDARHKAWGLHLWYQLEFSSTEDIRKIVTEYSKLGDIIETAEPVYKIEQYRNVPAPAGTRHNESINFTPNDTRFGEQWHFENTGQQGGTAGKDIRLTQAWDIETGDSNVIVGIVDGGIQLDHPDLAAHIWWGKGFNFVNNNNIIDADEHGTHTAGTVAAVSNNGVGVSGVAGGDGSAGSGVHLMSLEIFGPGGNANDAGAAYIWSADHGAVISQNSWGYTQPDVYQQSVLDGIDYFVANGGGTVLKGGLVVFAAGNNNSGSNFYPGSYEKVLAVAATNNKDVRSYYSNFGNYVDISAPGGEQAFTNDPHGVLSTTFNSGYEFLQGTSMACPHVSGVAALIVSRAPGRLSADDVKSILLLTTDDHYPLNSPAYFGKLGTGRLNAYKALQLVQDISSHPMVLPVSNYAASLNCPDIHLSWTKNGASDDVMIAYSADGLFGIPSGSYNAGDSLPGGGVIIYRGNDNSFDFPIPIDSSDAHFKIWSATAGNDYSLGQALKIKTAFSLVSFSGVEGPGNILLSWIRKCPFSDVIVAVNSTATFGQPSGNQQPGDNISGGGTVLYKGSADNFIYNSPVNGTNYFRIWPVINDSSYSSFFINLSVCYGSIAGPVSEGFESTTFPPSGWQLLNPEGGSVTWERSTVAHHSGSASAVLPCYTYQEFGQKDYLLSPPLNTTDADSVIFSFARAYRQYSSDFSDTLEIVISTDCGSSFVSAWKLGGADLATVAGSLTTSGFVASALDWKNTRIDLRPFIGNAPTFIAGFRSTNGYGQNLYVDDINISIVKAPDLDIAVSNLLEPTARICSQPTNPVIVIANYGKDTLQSATIYYRLDQLPADSITWTGKLEPGDLDTISFSNYNHSIGTIAVGNHILTVYAASPNGLTDQRHVNDTARTEFAALEPMHDPIKESFEQPGILPTGWTVTSSGSGYTWEKTSAASSDLASSMWIRNFRFSSNGKKDDLYSPIVKVDHPDSVYLSFDVAHATKVFPGTTTLPLDTLEVLLTTDCGNSFRSVYKKWGSSLVTINPNIPPQYDPSDTIGFLPTASQWRKEWIDITQWVPAGSRFQVVFRNSNNNGNNSFIDKVDISTVTLPAGLKDKGYLISPNPFDNSFSIRHLLPPVHLRGIQVSNAAGQLLITRSYSGNAGNFILVDMGRYANGMYQVKLIYDNKVITERIIKRR